MKKSFTLILILAIFMSVFSGCGPKEPAEDEVLYSNQKGLQLLTDYYEERMGSFTLTEETRLFAVTTENEDTVLQWASFLRDQFAAAELPSQAPMAISDGTMEESAPGDIVLLWNPDMVSEAYEILVGSEGIRVTAGDRRGMMYGIFMLIKAFRANGTMTLGACTISDTPDAPERVVMLDCGRKYYTKEWICNFIRQSAYMGYNAIELRFRGSGNPIRYLGSGIL